ncbi:MAG: hypothetical protein E5V61_11365, partial [Mesorhizobium sp.]
MLAGNVVMMKSRQPSWSVSALRRPPLSCRTAVSAPRSTLHRGQLAKAVMAANLPPCGGDARQGRG